jgi:hypothetical protein
MQTTPQGGTRKISASHPIGKSIWLTRGRQAKGFLDIYFQECARL